MNGLWRDPGTWGPLEWILVGEGFLCYALLLRRCFHLLPARSRAARAVPGEDPVVEPYASLIAVAPLLGLLGTLIGIGEHLRHEYGHGVAGRGIGRALWTTQFGLAIAVPALLLDRWRLLLERRARRAAARKAQPC